MNKLNVFKNELKQIESEPCKLIAEYVIKNTEDYFFDMPASTSGKFHPRDELDKGGKILHLKKAFYLADQAARKYGFKKDQYDKNKNEAVITYDTRLKYDILRTACLIHDMPFCFIWDDVEKKYRTNPTHAALNASFIYNHFNGFLDKELLNDFTSAVFYHMGKWTQYDKNVYHKLVFDIQNANQAITKAVHEVDFYVSRKMINVDLNETDY